MLRNGKKMRMSLRFPQRMLLHNAVGDAARSIVTIGSRQQALGYCAVAMLARTSTFLDYGGMESTDPYDPSFKPSMSSPRRARRNQSLSTQSRAADGRGFIVVHYFICTDAPSQWRTCRHLLQPPTLRCVCPQNSRSTPAGPVRMPAKGLQCNRSFRPGMQPITLSPHH